MHKTPAWTHLIKPPLYPFFWLLSLNWYWNGLRARHWRFQCSYLVLTHILTNLIKRWIFWVLELLELFLRWFYKHTKKNRENPPLREKKVFFFNLLYFSIATSSKSGSSKESPGGKIWSTLYKRTYGKYDVELETRSRCVRARRTKYAARVRPATSFERDIVRMYAGEA